VKTFTLEIRSLDRNYFSGQVTGLTAPAVDGGIGILADHAPLATILAPGKVSFEKSTGEEIKIDGGAGFLLVRDNVATVLFERGAQTI
jgi:F-type H+-transporting ATPase subunit epsilon